MQIIKFLQQFLGKTASKSSPVRKFPPITAIFCSFDVLPVGPPQKFQVQAKTSIIRPVFRDYLSVFFQLEQIGEIKRILLSKVLI